MTRYLLDTNVLSDLIRNPQGKVADAIARVGEDRVATSIIVASELRFGAAKKGAPRLTAQVDAVLGVLPVLAFERPADEHYAAVRAQLEHAGTPIGANDLLLAAHALALDHVLITDNEREFTRVETLRIANWLR